MSCSRSKKFFLSYDSYTNFLPFFRRSHEFFYDFNYVPNCSYTQEEIKHRASICSILALGNPGHGRPSVDLFILQTFLFRNFTNLLDFIASVIYNENNKNVLTFICLNKFFLIFFLILHYELSTLLILLKISYLLQYFKYIYLCNGEFTD